MEKNNNVFQLNCVFPKYKTELKLRKKKEDHPPTHPSIHLHYYIYQPTYQLTYSAHNNVRKPLLLLFLPYLLYLRTFT